MMLIKLVLTKLLTYQRKKGSPQRWNKIIQAKFEPYQITYLPTKKEKLADVEQNNANLTQTLPNCLLTNEKREAHRGGMN